MFYVFMSANKGTKPQSEKNGGNSREALHFFVEFMICVRIVRLLQHTLIFSKVWHSLLVAEGPTQFGTVCQTTNHRSMVRYVQNIVPYQIHTRHNYHGTNSKATLQICSNAKSYRIGKRLPYANEQLRVCHLLSNCYTCVNGNKSSSYQKFKINPPVLEKYLQL